MIKHFLFHFGPCIVIRGLGYYDWGACWETLYIMQMKKIARRQSEDAQGGEKNKKNAKSSAKLRKNDVDAAGPYIKN